MLAIGLRCAKAQQRNMSYQRILVAVDQSVQSQIVFAKALELAQKLSGRLMIFNRLTLDELETKPLRYKITTYLVGLLYGYFPLLLPL